jgi:hypothetical protein
MYMDKKYKRTPKNYDGVVSPIKELKNILPNILNGIEENYAKKPSNILSSWKEIIGKDLAVFTEATSLKDGILVVKVKNSTLYSLLSQHEKEKILKTLQNKFSKEAIRNIIFRIG